MTSLETFTTSPEMQPLEDYYFIPRAKEIFKMEYYLGLSRGGLDGMMSSLNQIKVRADVKKLLEEEQYALSPTQKTLQTLLDLHECNQERAHNHRRMFTKVLPIGQYTYHLVPTSTSSPPIQSADCSNPSSQSTKFLIRSYVHPALVVAATNPISNCFPLQHKKMLLCISSFYLLELPARARTRAEWRPHNDKAHIGGYITQRLLAQRSQLRPADALRGERQPLSLGLPEMLPSLEYPVRLQVYCRHDASVTVVNDIDIGDYANEPSPAAADVIESGDDWKRTLRLRLAIRRLKNSKSLKKETRKRWNCLPGPSAVKHPYITPCTTCNSSWNAL
ncbi:hypothetical protein BDZ89DRAFT_1069303 [Hymenopellis radicata]|nr:hypothetical protein BDZ89DRAFT_1069303 [Hymenopellis radicata]